MNGWIAKNIKMKTIMKRLKLQKAKKEKQKNKYIHKNHSKLK